MNDETVDTIRDTPLGKCIGSTLLDITADDREEIENGKSRVYLHFSNGETIFATIGDVGDGLLGMIDMEAV